MLFCCCLRSFICVLESTVMPCLHFFFFLFHHQKGPKKAILICFYCCCNPQSIYKAIFLFSLPCLFAILFSLFIFVNKSFYFDHVESWVFVFHLSFLCFSFQGVGLVKPMEGSRAITERKPRPQKEQALNCPRCNSTNTKFCYYNNYSLTQPRYFCKTCRRYWTEGGSLRNVPVGGGSRKNKRSSSSSSPSPSSKKLPDHLGPPSFSSQSASQNPRIHENLNLAYPASTSDNYHNALNPNPSSTSPHVSAMELLKTGIASRGLSSFMPMPIPDSNSIYPSGFPMQEFKPSLNFSLDGFESGYHHNHHQENSGARLFFPFEELKQAPNTAEIEQNSGQGGPSGYWSGMLGGGAW